MTAKAVTAEANAACNALDLVRCPALISADLLHDLWVAQGSGVLKAAHGRK
jgi:hypothetical protein